MLTCIFVYGLVLSLQNKFYMSFCFVARMRTRLHHEEASCRNPSPVVSFAGFVFLNYRWTEGSGLIVAGLHCVTAGKREGVQLKISR